MARTRSGASLIDDAYEVSDLVGFTDRHPRTQVLRWINQGGAELWDIILSARGRAFGRSANPWSITTVADTVLYTSGYPADFLDLISVRLAGPGGEMLHPVRPEEEAFLREPGIYSNAPEFYELAPGGLRLFPLHESGKIVIVEYAKTFTDLTDSSGSLFDGFNGWEDYLVYHAASEMLKKEGERQEADGFLRDKAMLKERIMKRLPARDGYGPRRAKDVRGERMGGGGGWFR